MERWRASQLEKNSLSAQIKQNTIIQNPAKLFFLVGPSGVGKDSLLDYLKQYQVADQHPLVAHRYITRPVREGDENHVALSACDFSQRKSAGLFLFDWYSHDYSYGIGQEVKQWLSAGQNVIINGSRQYLATALEVYPDLIPVWISVSKNVLRERLVQRGRETGQQIEDRLQRNQAMEKLKPDNCYTIKNDRFIVDAVNQLLSIINQNQQEGERNVEREIDRETEEEKNREKTQEND